MVIKLYINTAAQLIEQPTNWAACDVTDWI